MQTSTQPLGPQSQQQKKYYCHTCKKEIQNPIQNPEAELVCPHCQKDFVEEIDEEYPPVPPAPAPQQQQQQQPPLPPIFNPFPAVTINGQPSLLPIAQIMRFLTTQPNNNNNPNTNNAPNRIHFQHGPVHFQQYSNNNNTNPPFNPTQQPLPPIFNTISNFLPNFNFGGPIVGNPGDYVFGPNFEQILNQLFQNANHSGAPPAAKTAVDDLKKGKIDESQVENKSDCAICKEEFSLGSEYIEMPCKHIFDKECILQWLGIHNSCPVCRFELKTDNPDYEARHPR